MIKDISLIALGVFLILAIYHIFIFLGRKNDLSNLAYSLINWGFALFLFSRFNKSMDFIRISNENILNLLNIISSVFTSGSLALFAHIIFDLKKIKIYSMILFVFLLSSGIIIYILYSITNNIKYIMLINLAGALYAALFLIIILFYVIITQQLKEKNKKIIFIGYIILLTGITVSALLLFSGKNPDISRIIWILSYFILICLFALSLTSSFNKEHRDLINFKNTLEQKVKERTQELEEANQQKTDFFINLAHETRTPLSLIRNYLDAYIEKQKPSKDLDIIKSNFEKLLRNMNNYLNLEKLNRGPNQICYDHSRIINLAEILKDKVELFKAAAGKRNIEIMLSINAENIYIKMDPFAIDQILDNLLDNGIKYNKIFGRISIFLNIHTDRIELVIRDTGIGIADDQIKNLFKTFHQMYHEKRQIQGLGMGLSIVKKIIEQVDGEIKVESKLDEGTTFKIILKKYTLQKEDRVQENIKLTKPIDTPDVMLLPEPYNENKPVIYALEDNIEFLSHLQSLLKGEYNFYYAMDGKKALEEIVKIPKKPDVLMIDIMLPGMDGFTFHDELIKNDEFRSVSFIFLTAKTGIDDKLKGLRKGAVDYIIKSEVTKEELIAKINSLIKIQKAQKYKTEKKLVESMHDYAAKKEKELREIPEKTFDEKCKEFGITPKEKEIILLIREGLSYKEIANKLYKSPNTISNHSDHIYKKCNVTDKVKLINLLFRN